MEKCSQKPQFIKEEITWSVLEQVARDGARKMLALALENEVAEFVERHCHPEVPGPCNRYLL